MRGADFSVTFERRDFSAPLLAHGLRVRVKRLHWRAVGGPWSAELEVSAPDRSRLWGVMDLLRCGVRISDRLGLAWWGYVSAAELQHGAERVRVSLDAMGNRVAVGYRPYHPGSGGAGRSATAFEVDSSSVRVFGEKERMFLLDQASAAEAAAYARTMLRQVSRPQVAAGPPGQAVQPAGSSSDGALRATLHCRGWWETLDWKFAPEPRGLLAYEQGGVGYNLGSSATQQAFAGSFHMGAQPWRIGEAWIKARRVGQPGDALQMVIWANSGGTPSGNPLASSSAVPPAEVPDALGWVRFTFGSYYQPPANTTLWLGVIRTAWQVNATHYYQIGLDPGLGDSASTMTMFNGAAWVTPSPNADLARIVLGVEESSEQLRRLLSGGQFLSGARVETASGVMAGLYRSGSERGRAVAERLLKLGASSGGRLLARVEADRFTRVYPQPAAESAQVRIDSAGRLCDPNRRVLAPSEWPAGQWARQGELSATGGLYGYDGSLFLEACAWDEERGLHALRE